jgi:hypothetical protein
LNHVDAAATYGFELSGRDGIYAIDWPDLHIHARVDRIRESHDHDVKGEVCLTSSRPTSSGHLRQGRILLTSPASRKTMAKALEERDSEVDWDQVMEQLCVAVLSHYRSGSSEVQLGGDIDVEAHARWLVEPIVQLNNPSLLYGPGSTGKSWFAQFLAVLADHGTSAGGLHVEPATVLYLDWETDQAEIGSRITMIRRGLGLEGQSHIWYKAMNQGLSSDLETIRTIVVDRTITFIVLDSLGSACMGEPESAEVVLRMFSALRSLGISSLCVDHTNKEGYLFGSVYKFNSSRQIFEIKKHQEPDENKLVFGLFHKKANNSKLVRDMGYELSFADGKVIFERRDVRDTVLEEHMRIADRIESLLRRGPRAALDLAETLEKSESHIRKELSEGTRRGKFVRLEDGTHRYANRIWESEASELESWKL